MVPAPVFTVRATNNGPDEASGVVLEYKIGRGFQFITCNPYQGTVIVLIVLLTLLLGILVICLLVVELIFMCTLKLLKLVIILLI